MTQRTTSVTRAVLAFALSGLLVLILVGIAGVLVLRRVGTAEAMTEAEDLTTVAARGVVQPRLTAGILHGDTDSLIAVDTVVNGGVLRDPIVRVKIRDARGRVLYSDEPRLIGRRFPLSAEELDAMARDAVVAGLADLAAPQHHFETDLGPLLEVSLPVRTPNDKQLLFQTTIRFDSVAASSRRLWGAFVPVLAVALLALALLQIPLAYRLAQRVHRGEQERERLLQRAIDASDLERRRIASDLHDGPVQQLAGLSLSLSAQADALPSGDPSSATLRDAADATRQGMRSMRSALMGIYPPSLEQAGLRAALSDLIAPLSAYGLRAEVEVPEDLRLPPDVDALLFRASQEALRNVVTHANAKVVTVHVSSSDGRATLEIADDGAGFSPDRQEEAQAEGHLGLKLLSDLARDVDGTLDVTSEPGRGTRVRVEVPLG
jgi:two-component system NarL family sensor kinase